MRAGNDLEGDKAVKKPFLLFSLLVIALLVSGFGSLPFLPGGQKAKTDLIAANLAAAPIFLVDDFEDGSYTEAPEWYVFDNIIPAMVQNSRLPDSDLKYLKSLGKYSLQLRGATSTWYVGGIGTILQSDVAAYDTFVLSVYGYGEYSGVLKIELYDDDNNNGEIEVDPKWLPLYDDRFIFEVPVNWKGWRPVVLPIKDFKVDGGGNKIFDPGLIKIQLIGIANSESGSVKFNVDNLSFIQL